MGLFSNLFGRKSASSASTPNDGTAVSLSLQLLLEEWRIEDEAALASALSAYDSSLRSARISSFVRSETNSAFADIEWQNQKFRLVAFDLPMPSEAVEHCLQPAAFDVEIKDQARAHAAHALLFCDSLRAEILQNYVRMAMLCGGLLETSGGLAVLNESAQTAMFARTWHETAELSRFEFWNTLPILFLYAGFVKFMRPESPEVWMTTRGLNVWGLPNLTTLAADHSQASKVFEHFNNIAAYLVSNGPVLAAGHTMQIGANAFMRLREPQNDEERAVAGDYPLLVADFIGSDEANTSVFPSKGLSN